MRHRDFIIWVFSSRQQHNRQRQRNHSDKRKDGHAPAEQQQQASSVRSAEQRSRSLYRTGHGDVPAVRWQRANSVRNAELKNRKKTDGDVPAAVLIRVSSVRSAEQRNRQVFLCIAATNVAGSRKIRHIRQNSVRSAGICLMRTTAYSRRQLHRQTPGFGRNVPCLVRRENL